MNIQHEHNFIVIEQDKEIYRYGEKDAKWQDFIILLCTTCGEMKKVWVSDIEVELKNKKH